jgi:hypothetical protein
VRRGRKLANSHANVTIVTRDEVIAMMDDVAAQVGMTRKQAIRSLNGKLRGTWAADKLHALMFLIGER